MKRPKKFLILVSVTALVLLTMLGSMVSATAGSSNSEPPAGQTLPVIDQGSAQQVTCATTTNSESNGPGDSLLGCTTPKGKICGTKFVVDENGSNKTRKAGVTINLTGRTTRSTVTTSDGTYCFGDLEMGTYYVSEVVPSGYTKIVPSNEKYMVTLKDCARNATCIDFINQLKPAPKGKISGTKYVKDANGNLTPMGGVTILLSGTKSDSTVTASDGTYYFSDLALGTYTVSEVVPAGYQQVGPPQGSYSVELTKCHLSEDHLDFVNKLVPPPPPPPKGEIYGTKYVKDCNGDLTPMGGVTILLAGTETDSTVTASDGTYSFTDLELGDYTVSEVVPAGYKQIEPDSDYEFELSVCEPVVDELDFINELLPGSILGHKWQDNNWDHVHQAGEPGMAGVTIELWQNGSMIKSTVTAADGSYSFDNLAPGNYTVKEVVESHMVACWPTSVDATVVSNQPVTGIDFLNYWAYGVVSVVVYVDSNCNGVWDASDQLVTIPVTVELYQVINGQMVPADGYDGSYQKQTGAGVYPPIWWPWVTPYPSGCTGWNNLPVDDGSGAAWYYIKMQVPQGYYALDSTERGPYALKPGIFEGSCSWWHEVFLLSHEFSVTGHKWQDSNENGQHDDGEPPVAGVPMELWQNGSKLASTVTAADGSYSFTGLKEGIYTVKEIVPDGWEAEVPDGGVHEDVHVGCGDVANLDFLNILKKGSIHGVKYLDANADGIYEEGSPGFAGVTIQLKQGDTVIQTTTTDEDGKYVFNDVPAGTYDVEEVLTAGMASKAATVINGVVVAPGADVSLDEQPFLNYMKGSISGYKFLDQNTNKVQDAGENGLAGITINLYTGNPEVLVDTKVTGADGSFSFTGLEPGQYRVAEVLTQEQKAMYFATTSDSQDVEVVEGDNVPVEFGNAEYGRVEGFKFEDKNGDGKFQSGEEHALEGIVVTLTGNGITPREQTTGEDGTFFFDGLRPGAYTVTETVPAGYYATMPLAVDIVVNTGDSVPVMFANCEYGKIIANKYLDDGDNELNTAKDKPGAGITINVTGTTNTGDPADPMTGTTGADGSYEFLQVKAGTYTVSEELDTSKYTAILPTSEEVTLLPGDTEKVAFLNSETTVLPQPPITPEPITQSTQLPHTGMDQLPLLIAAGFMVLLGLLLLFAGRKRRLNE